MTGRSERTRRVAVVGLDGSGKSSVIARLREIAGVGFSGTTCPDFHDTPDAPLHVLSRAMKAFSDGADEIGSTEAKVLAMYCQMTLYGPVERFFLDTYAPSVFVCERHPLIESFVYGPFYSGLMGTAFDGTAIETEARRVLDRHAAGTLELISTWNSAVNRRVGSEAGLWETLPEILDVLTRDFGSAAGSMAARYRTDMPDVVLWLDAPPLQAAARCAERSGGLAGEMHETAEFLTVLRHGYLDIRAGLAEHYPQVEFHQIDTSDDAGLDESVRACVEKGTLL